MTSTPHCQLSVKDERSRLHSSWQARQRICTCSVSGFSEMLDTRKGYPSLAPQLGQTTGNPGPADAADMHESLPRHLSEHVITGQCISLRFGRARQFQPRPPQTLEIFAAALRQMSQQPEILRGATKLGECQLAANQDAHLQPNAWQAADTALGDSGVAFPIGLRDPPVRLFFEGGRRIGRAERYGHGADPTPKVPARSEGIRRRTECSGRSSRLPVASASPPMVALSSGATVGGGCSVRSNSDRRRGRGRRISATWHCPKPTTPWTASCHLGAAQRGPSIREVFA